MYELYFSLYGSKKSLTGTFGSFNEARKHMEKLLNITEYVECSEFVIKNTVNGRVVTFTHNEEGLKVS